MIIVTIGNVKLKYASLEEAANVFRAVCGGVQVEEEYLGYNVDRVFHPAKWYAPVEIAFILGDVVPWAEPVTVTVNVNGGKE